MTDHPRFEAIEGPPMAAHRHHGGGRLAGMAFRLADLVRRRAAGVGVVWRAPALDADAGARERPAAKARAGHRQRRIESNLPMPAWRGLSPEETFAHAFITGSARTRRLQAVLLAGAALILAALVLLEIGSYERPSSEPVRHPDQPSAHVMPPLDPVRPAAASAGAHERQWSKAPSTPSAGGRQ